MDSPSANPSRSGFARAAFGLLMVSLTSYAAGAAGLRSLHVLALGMHADRTQVRIGEPFHVAVHVRVKENVAALDELVIPDVGTLQIIGDERHTTHGPGGTDVVETITLQSPAAGRYTISPAYLDAIDARTGRPSRFSSNPLTIVVAAAAANLPAAPLHALAQTLGWAIAAIAVVALLLVVMRRRRGVPVLPAAPAPLPPPAAPPRTPHDDVAEALRAYRVSPSTAALLRLRATLFAAAGAADGATLRDALAATSDARLRSALLAAERTAFGPAAERDAASGELVDMTAGWL